MESILITFWKKHSLCTIHQVGIILYNLKKNRKLRYRVLTANAQVFCSSAADSLATSFISKLPIFKIIYCCINFIDCIVYYIKYYPFYG